ncbi:amidase [Dietzia alimentaria]|uniref:amidase n=1 Tax=Dietzia alimentaria TaxID=665550 RepID=UPI00029A11CE|nr:amidase family protein [Dietzia alimentaria]
MTTDPLTAIETAEKVRAGAIRASATLDAAVERVADLDPTLRAFTSLLHAESRAAADAVDAMGQEQRERLPLAGVPLAIKSTVTPDNPAVAPLLAAGAVPMGMTAAPQLCTWGMTDSEAHGITRNPLDVSRSPGGSSGGSAAAVASGMVPLAVGDDGMGSLRIPAAACGLATIKPGPGVVGTSLSGGNWGGMAESGPLARTVADVALALSVMAGRPELAGIDHVPGGTRIGLSVASPIRLGRDLVRIHEPWKRAAREAAAILRGDDLVVVDTPLPSPKDPVLYLARWTSAVARAAEDENLPLSAMERRTRHHALLGRTVFRNGGADGGDTRWNRGVAALRADVERAMDSAGVDVWLTPALADVPPEATEWHRRSWGRSLWASMRYSPFTPLANVLGWPAMSVPCGATHSPLGRVLPTSVQLVGRPGSEATLLGLAAVIERGGR